MKPIHFSITLLLLLPLLLPAQTVSINEFYRKYKNVEEENVHVTLPGWVVKLGVGIAKTQVDDQEEKEAINLAKKIRKLRVLTFEEANPVAQKDLDRLMKGVRKENFEDLIMVKEENTKVHLMMREKKEQVKNLLILVSEEDTFTMVSMKTKLRYDQIEEFINKALKDDEGNIEVKL
ncbi:MAG: DUF4252 domain-containing protein [Saprospirales bacterium]|nr:DUF4252 domain-containing protein [Saprospirales bacterium]